MPKLILNSYPESENGQKILNDQFNSSSPIESVFIVFGAPLVNMRTEVF